MSIPGGCEAENSTGGFCRLSRCRRGGADQVSDALGHLVDGLVEPSASVVLVGVAGIVADDVVRIMVRGEAGAIDYREIGVPNGDMARGQGLQVNAAGVIVHHERGFDQSGMPGDTSVEFAATGMGHAGGVDAVGAER